MFPAIDEISKTLSKFHKVEIITGLNFDRGIRYFQKQNHDFIWLGQNHTIQMANSSTKSLIAIRPLFKDLKYVQRNEFGIKLNLTDEESLEYYMSYFS